MQLEKITQQAQRKSPHKSARDAIALLTEDHGNVKKMFQEFAELVKSNGKNSPKEKLVKQICEALKAHALVEEEIFYPAVRAAIDDDALMDEADVEHASAKIIIAQLETMNASGDHYDALVTVLGEQIDHHVKEEQDDMFTQARKAKVDLAALGAQIAARKEELLSA